MGIPASHSTGDSSLHRGAAYPCLQLEWGLYICLLLLCKGVCIAACLTACSALTAYLELKACTASLRLS